MLVWHHRGHSWSTCVVMQEKCMQNTSCLDQRLIRAKIPLVREPPDLSKDDGKRPDGLTRVRWQSERSATWDMTVVHTLPAS